MPLTQVGNELLEADFGEILRSIVQGIADGQRALDIAAVKTLSVLANTPVSIIPEITEVLTPQSLNVPVSGLPSGVTVTGVRVTDTPSDPVTMSALQAGILPTFYQFTETTIELRLSIQLKQATVTETDGSTDTRIFAFGSHVNFRNQNTFSYQVDASSSVTTTLKPVPASNRIVPKTVVVNNLGKTPTVVVNQ